MKKSESFRACIMIGLLFIIFTNCSMAAAKTNSTAEAFIRVLPYADKDPFSISEPVVDWQMQNQFRRSIAKLMKQQTLLNEVINRSVIQKTQWYKNFDKNTEERNSKALADLQNNLQIAAIDDADLISVSMTCDNIQDAALIADEVIEVFVKKQRELQTTRIRGKLAELQNRRGFLESELMAAERALEEVQNSFGFADLREHQYPLTEEIRVNRLTEIKDDLILQLAETEKQQASTDLLKAKLDKVEKMLAEAIQNKNKMNAAKNEYQKRIKIRDQIQSNLNQVKTLIEKYRIMAEDPDIAKIQVLQRASVIPNLNIQD